MVLTGMLWGSLDHRYRAMGRARWRGYARAGWRAAKTLNQSRTTIVQSAVQAFIRLSPEDQHEAVAAYLTRSLKQPAAKKGRTRG